MKYIRMPIEKESPEELGYAHIKYNLAESSVSDVLLKDIRLNIGDLCLCYTDHKGKPELRQWIINNALSLNANHVLLTVGAAGALFIIATSLLTKDDHLIVVRPNYATNIETPKAIGCEISYADLHFENQWQPDVELIASLIKPNTRYISITNPHNPTGTVINNSTILQLVKLAEKHGVYLLVDETYRDLLFGELQPPVAALSKRVISVSSVSKAYGLPGLRLGWLITQDEDLMELFLAAKEQIHITNSVLDEEVAFQFLQSQSLYLPGIQQKIQQGFSILEEWMNKEERLEWVKPGGGVVCFPRVKSKYSFDAALFYEQLLSKYSTMAGPGHWFEMPDSYMRIGYGWPTLEELAKGLDNISKMLDDTVSMEP